MLQIYCADKHAGAASLCTDCASLFAYAEQRLEKCPYGDDKPTCANCPIHCYHPRLREQIKEVMRYAGPRMIRRHPVLATLHLLEGRRPAPPPPKRKAAPQ
jgi:hypothetical protein